MTRQTALRRLTAGIGALALALVGAVGVSSAASAATPGNIDPGATGTIIIHKHVLDGQSTPGNPAGAPLNGVTFKVTEVLHDGISVPLATSEGWTAIDGLTAGAVPGGDFTLGTSQNVVTGTTSPGVGTTTNVGVGLYLVEEIASGPNLITAPADPFLVTIPYPGDDGWEYNVDVYPKNILGTPNPTKTAGTPDSPADIELGAIVPFVISLPIAQSALPYESISIEDVLGTGLAFDSWSSIAIAGAAPLVLDTDYSVSADDSTITLLAAGLAKVNAITATTGTTFTATLNAEVTALGQLKNSATGTINGKPGHTPDVQTNWAGLDIMKVDDSTEAALGGATFELYAEDMATVLATGTTLADGTLSFIVWVGNDSDTTETVFLKETVAPPGYVLPSDPWSGPYVLTAGTTAEASITLDTIENFMPDGVTLPLTGAQGTTMMTFGGLFIIAAGASLLLVRRRQHSVTKA